jgi:hypothetical protein
MKEKINGKKLKPSSDIHCTTRILSQIKLVNHLDLILLQLYYNKSGKIVDPRKVYRMGPIRGFNPTSLYS